ncbi:MAG: carbohydrate kinase family protein [Candidatus Thorarchaeota archaeon]
MTATRFDLVVVGHLTIDLTKFEDVEKKRLGGPPAYAMIASSLGFKNVGIVSRIGKKFPRKYYEILGASGLNLDGIIRDEETTEFINEYSKDGHRIQFANHVANCLTSADVPKPYWNTEWMHISPVLGETDSSLIVTAKKHQVKVSVDAQGFVRKRIEPENRIVGCEWPDFVNVASEINILKADIDEIKHLTQTPTYQKAAKAIHQMGCPIILITRGQQGSFISQETSLIKIPPMTPEKVVDLTGSGDVFALSFLIEYQRTQRPIWSAFFASSAASYNLETPGPCNFPSSQKVVSRLRRFLSIPDNRDLAELLINESGPGDCPL